jgi:hypothetical protein
MTGASGASRQKHSTHSRRDSGSRPAGYGGSVCRRLACRTGTWLTGRAGRRKGLLSVPFWRISFFTMRSISGCKGSIRPSRSNATLTTRSATARAKRRRLSYVRRWTRGLRRVGYGCTRRRPRSSTAKMPIVPGNTRSGHSTFSATRFGRERRLAEPRGALSASSPRSGGQKDTAGGAAVATASAHRS